jgi:hypothetical protein
MATPRGPSRPEGACRRCASSPETSATPSSSRRCRPRRNHFGLRRRSAPRSTGRGSTSRTGHLLLHRRAPHTSSSARARARTPGLRVAGTSAGEMGTVLLLLRGGAHLQLLEQRRRGWGRLDLVNSDKGAGAAGGPHPRIAPELALRWQGGRRRGGSSSHRRPAASDCDEAAGVAPDQPAAMPGCWLRIGGRWRLHLQSTPDANFRC